MKQEFTNLFRDMEKEFGFPYPGDSQLVSGNTIEHNQVAAYFRGKHWSDVTLEWLNDYVGDPSACLWFMTPAAVRFYLPAYLRISLEHYHTSNAIPDAVIHMLELAATERNGEVAQALDPLTQEQKRVIARYLHLMSKEYWHLYPVDSAALALEPYWGQYL